MTTTHNQNLSKSDKELIIIISKILNKEKREVLNYLELFNNINPVIRNSLRSLSTMNKDQIISTHLSLEDLLRFNKDIASLMKK